MDWDEGDCRCEGQGNVYPRGMVPRTEWYEGVGQREICLHEKTCGARCRGCLRKPKLVSRLATRLRQSNLGRREGKRMRQDGSLGADAGDDTTVLIV